MGKCYRMIWTVSVNTRSLNGQTTFNTDKCKVIHYGKGSISFKYSMHGKLLDDVSSEKDLGVTFSKDLKVTQQCEEAYKKASQILGLIHRTIQFKNPAVLISLYKSMVRPHLENCSVAWIPHYVARTSAAPFHKNVPGVERSAILATTCQVASMVTGRAT